MDDTIMLMSDPRVAAVPIQECGEPLVEAADHFAPTWPQFGSTPFRSRVRAGLLHRLLQAQSTLPAGYRIGWAEGHRDPVRQRAYFMGYRDRLRVAGPDRSDAELDALASRYVAPPEIAPHVSGAAVDLTLCDDLGASLNMGCALNATPEESDGACYFAAEVGTEARRHRGILAAALSSAGLVNYPTEWWHWSYGDRYWAALESHQCAIYGPIEG